MKYCPTCSHDFPTTAAFCKYCGGGLIAVEGNAGPEMMNCPSCGANVNSGTEVCTICSYRFSQSTSVATGLPEVPRICSACGTDNPADADFCRECGERIGQTLSAGSQGNEPAQTLILNFPQPAYSSESPTQAAMQMCNHCGSWNRRDLKFCEICGKPLGTEFSRPEARSKTGKIILIATGGFVLLASLFLFWFFWGVGVTIHTSPPGARVFIDGAEIGETSMSDGLASVSHLGHGQHTLRVEQQGFTTVSRTFELGALDFSKTIEAKLDPSVFTLTIITDPPGCRIWLDSIESVQTNDDNGESVLADIPRGPHSLRLSRTGYQDWTRDISLDSPQVIRANLTPLAEEPSMAAPDNNSSSDATSSSPEREVEMILQGWARSLSDKDLDTNLRYYSEHLDNFLTMSNVSRDQVRSTRMKLFARYASINIQLSNIHINLDPSGTRAIATVDTQYDFRGSKSLNGSAQDELWLEKRGSSWLITNEKHIQTYYENAGN